MKRPLAYGEQVEGTPFGRYRLIELLGHGGMGEVWRAHDTAIDRMVALKMLLPHFAQDRTFEQRFRREARAAARLDDPHVVPIYDFGELDGRLYLTMRLINGDDLKTLLDGGPLKPERAVGIIEQVASALHAAHEVRLVHRDVKPSNILLTANDFTYLIDFGIARAAEDTELTSSGATFGTWHYMAPERYQTGAVDARGDVYALAAVLHECLTGCRPFPGDSLPQQMHAHIYLDPPRPSEERPDVAKRFDEVVARGMAKDPDRRYQTAVELAADAKAAITEPMSVRSADSTLAGTTLPATKRPLVGNARKRTDDQSNAQTREAEGPAAKKPQDPAPAKKPKPAAPAKKAKAPSPPHAKQRLQAAPAAATKRQRQPRLEVIGLVGCLVVILILVAIAVSAEFHNDGNQSVGSNPTSTSRSVVASTLSTSATPSSAASLPTDYSALLIKDSDIPGGAFTMQPPQLNPGGKPGVAATFANQGDTREIGDTILVLPNASVAASVLQRTITAAGPTVSGGTPQPVDVGTGGTMLSGTSPDGAKAITILMFSEGKAAVTIEFDGAANDPVPKDGALDIAKKQDAAIKAGLPI